MVQLLQLGDQKGLIIMRIFNQLQIIFKKLLRIRDVVLNVNQAYIRSAAMNDDYREEPAFKLQASYRNMNKLAEKVVPIMNEKELETLILAHYEGEVQTLTANAEANWLKLKELMDILNDEETKRWEDIKKTFQKNNQLRGLGHHNPIGQLVAQVGRFADEVEDIKDLLGKNWK